MSEWQQGFRLYGAAPRRIVVLHGGPGALGGMAPVARHLSRDHGVLEPLLAETSIADQLERLKALVAEEAETPVMLIGWSWGAMLGYIFAAYYPELLARLVMIGSAVFDERYAVSIMATRLSRMAAADRREVERLSAEMTVGRDRNAAMTLFGQLIERADAYRPDLSDAAEIDCRCDTFDGIWPEARDLRRSGALLELGRRITCPVIALHGDYDPHPAAGVRQPLSAVLQDFHFTDIEHCGHAPWIEVEARETFYALLDEALRESPVPQRMLSAGK